MAVYVRERASLSLYGITLTPLFLCISSALSGSIDAGASAVAIREITHKLGLNEEYAKEPCKLMPFVELSPLLAIDELVIRMANDPVEPISIDKDTAQKAKMVYYKIGLHSMKYAICLMTLQVGPVSAIKVINRWVSGYVNQARKLAVVTDLTDSIKTATTLQTEAECLQRGAEDLKKHRIEQDIAKLIKTELRKIKDRLEGKHLTSSQLKAATEAIALQCLVFQSDIQYKKETAHALQMAASFFHRLEGGVLQTVIGKKGNTELINLLLRGILNARFVSNTDRMNRAFLMLNGDEVARQRCDGVSADQCIKIIQ